MKRQSLLIFLVLGLVFLARPVAASALAPLDVRSNEAVIDFPNTITFRAQIQADAEIKSVVLEYGATQLTCGQVVAKAFPQFNPGSSVDVEWTWDMRQSTSLPPGANIWWRWRVMDANGKETVSDDKNIIWLDSRHRWQTLSDTNLRLHWYEGSKAFAQQLMDAAKGGLALNEKSAGLKPDSPIDLYIYASYQDLRDAILYEASWVGGQAFAEHNIVIMGLAPDMSAESIAWDKSTVVHELTHVLIGHLTFSCLGFVPQWLNEGLAVYSEGALDPRFREALDKAIQQDTLLAVRSLNGNFPEVRDQVDLSYGESYSLVNFLVETYGQPKMTDLLTSLRDGSTTDEALTKVYGFDTEGLEDAWRAGIGAKMRAAIPNPTATPEPTFVPTIVPVAGVPLAATPTPYAVPTSSTGNNGNENLPAVPTPSVPSLPAPSLNDPYLVGGLGIGVLCCCLIVLIIIGVAIYFARRGKKGGDHA